MAPKHYKAVENMRIDSFTCITPPFPLDTVKPRPEAHMDMIHFEVFLKSIDVIPQQQILQRHYLYIIDNVIVLSDLVESSGYSSKTLQKGSCPYAPLDEVLR